MRLPPKLLSIYLSIGWMAGSLSVQASPDVSESPLIQFGQSEMRASGFDRSVELQRDAALYDQSYVISSSPSGSVSCSAEETKAD